MNPGTCVTLKQLNAALRDVQKRMANMGIWHANSRLTKVEVYWCRLPQVIACDALGFYLGEIGGLGRFFGYTPGHIYIPQWVLAQGLRQNRGSLRETLIHEYGHALAYRYPRLVRRNGQFKQVFGAPHDECHDGGMWEEHGDAAFISPYAMTNPCEDFAETFTHWVRWDGIVPKKLHNPVLKRKWGFVRDTVKAVSAGLC